MARKKVYPIPSCCGMMEDADPTPTATLESGLSSREAIDSRNGAVTKVKLYDNDKDDVMYNPEYREHTGQNER